MWIKKSNTELFLEYQRRKTIGGFVALFVFAIYCLLIYLQWNKILGGLNDLPGNSELIGSIVLFPIFIYVGYKSYINHGGLDWTSERVCVGCGKTWMRSYDGWGFLSFGKRSKKWYQFKFCKTPENCEILGRHELKWAPESNERIKGGGDKYK